jgi:hypothetical protein
MDAKNNLQREFLWKAACAAVIAAVYGLHVYRGIGVVEAFQDIFISWFIIARRTPRGFGFGCGRLKWLNGRRDLRFLSRSDGPPASWRG